MSPDAPVMLQAKGVGWGEKTQDDIGLDPPAMRQAIGWSFALRNIRRAETEEAGQQLLKSTGAESVRDVKASQAAMTSLTQSYPQTDFAPQCCSWMMKVKPSIMHSLARVPNKIGSLCCI